MKKHFNKSVLIFAFVALCLILDVFLTKSVKAEAATKATVTLEFTDGTTVIWHSGDEVIDTEGKKLAYIYFGKYPQTEVTGKKLTKKIKNASYNEDGIASVKGTKYMKINKSDCPYTWNEDVLGPDPRFYNWSGKAVAYFKYEPIKWRVLSCENGQALLMSEYGIDKKTFNTSYKDISWADCTLRTWLNDTFLKGAFNSKEKKLIKTTKLKNPANFEWFTEGCENTKDKVFVLSLDDVAQSGKREYGLFSWQFEENSSRICQPTDYCLVRGTKIEYCSEDSEAYYRFGTVKVAEWWLRTPGKTSDSATYVKCDSTYGDAGDQVNDTKVIRPAITLNLKSIIK